MKNTVIECVGLSKQYRIGAARARYKTLRDSLSAAAGNSYRQMRSLLRGGERGARGNKHQTFWALKDVSLEIEKGEVVAIIGRNGAGKSTLLKILSRITEPTSGYADITGRVGALLEVGTGFHHELSGRENIFLNGSILGMKREEIARQFDAIVSFAEVEQFIDTPVKHYSSGMYLRLAFSVAAHLEPEILLVDEVLAVGDAAFQKKCMGKMDDVAHQGRTVIFVSHNMGAVQELCHRGILLDAGEVVYQGRPGDCISEYLRRLEEEPTVINQSASPLVLGQPRIESDMEGAIESSQPFTVVLPLRAANLRNPWLFFILEDFSGRSVLHKRISSQQIGVEVMDGEYRIDLDFPPLWLTPGVYAAQFKFILPNPSHGPGRIMSDKFMLEVRGEVEPSGKAVLNPRVEWTMEPTSLSPLS